MTIVAPIAIIETLWGAIARTASPNSRPSEIAVGQICGIARDVPAMGWAGRLEVVTVLQAAGLDVSASIAGDVLAPFGLRLQTVFPSRPRFSGGAMADERLAAADLAALMILLQRLGLPIDPTAMCDGIRKGLRGREFITESELAARWHAKERHRLEPLEIAVEGKPRWLRPAESVTGPAGYYAELFHDPAGRPHAIRVAAPLWRPRHHSAA